MHVVQNPLPPQALSIGTPELSAIFKIESPVAASTTFVVPATWNVIFGMRIIGSGLPYHCGRSRRIVHCPLHIVHNPPVMPSLLSIAGLHVSAEDQSVIRGVDLDVAAGEVHAVMGPNGSGKSTLVNALAGHPAYAITDGTATFDGTDLLAMSADERARAGLFLAFQYPRAVAGVPLRGLLLAALNARREARGESRMSPLQFAKALDAEMDALQMDRAFGERAVNVGFSGGEKKKAEILQLLTLSPRLALLDETDSGLDVDALRVVAAGVRRQRERNPSFAAVIVTHYARILEYLQPDHVHVMIRGRIVESGDAALAQRIESEGYAKYGVSDGGGIRLGLGD